MSKIRKIAGVKVRELNKPVEMKIITKAPSKWLLKDMETGQTYIGTGKKTIGDQWREINEEKYNWLEERTAKQYKSAALGAFIGWVGIILLCLIMLLYSGCLKTETIENVNDDEINLSYQDENVMWIGDNGDTIWE